MPFPLIEARAAEADAASAKVELARTSMPRLLVQAVVGGVLLAAAVLLMLLAVAPLIIDGSGLATPARGIVAGFGLAVAVVIGAELFPSTALTMVRGVTRYGVDIGDAGLVALTSLLGNLAGAIAFARLVDAIGVVPDGASVQQRALGALALDLGALGGTEMFLRSVVCSVVLSIGLVVAAATPAPRRRLLVMWAAAGVAAGIGLNLSVVGAALLSLAALSDVAVWGDVSRHLAATVPGNVVGAALVVAVTTVAGRPSAVGDHLERVAEVPAQPAPVKRAPAKKAPAKKAPAKKRLATKAPAKKAVPSRKAPAPRPPAKKVPGKKVPAKSVGAKRAASR